MATAWIVPVKIDTTAPVPSFPVNTIVNLTQLPTPADSSAILRWVERGIYAESPSIQAVLRNPVAAVQLFHIIHTTQETYDILPSQDVAIMLSSVFLVGSRFRLTIVLRIPVEDDPVVLPARLLTGATDAFAVMAAAQKKLSKPDEDHSFTSERLMLQGKNASVSYWNMLVITALSDTFVFPNQSTFKDTRDAFDTLHNLLKRAMLRFDDDSNSWPAQLVLMVNGKPLMYNSSSFRKHSKYNLNLEFGQGSSLHKAAHFVSQARRSRSRACL